MFLLLLLLLLLLLDFPRVVDVDQLLDPELVSALDSEFVSSAAAHRHAVSAKTHARLGAHATRGVKLMATRLAQYLRQVVARNAGAGDYLHGARLMLLLAAAFDQLTDEVAALEGARLLAGREQLGDAQRAERVVARRPVGANVKCPVKGGRYATRGWN